MTAPAHCPPLAAQNSGTVTSTRPRSRKRAVPWVAAALLPIVATLSCARGARRGIWARVDGTPIYRAQVEAMYRARQGVLPEKSRPDLALSFELSILSELIDRQLMLKRASELRIGVSNSELQARLAEVRGPDSPESFARTLTGEGTTPTELRQEVRENLVLQGLIQQEVVSRVRVTAGQVTAYYSQNKAGFEVPEPEYHLAQIVVTPVAEPEIRNLMHDDARNEVEAERKIKALDRQLRSGKDFAKVADDYSEDARTAPGGGDMGFIQASSLAAEPALRRALRSLKPGQITGILRDRSGFRIVKLLGRVNAGQRPLSDAGVRDSIRKTLANQQLELLKAAYIENLRDHAHIVNYLAEEILAHGGPARAVK
ncbi:MAG: peptidylprolyl isomerase [Terriglobia bacterium]